MRYATLALQIAGLAVRRPALWIPLLAAAWRFRGKRWYRRAPFLPLPDPDYLDWRLHTAYGDGAGPDAAALERYLEWVAHMRR